MDGEINPIVDTVIPQCDTKHYVRITYPATIHTMKYITIEVASSEIGDQIVELFNTGGKTPLMSFKSFTETKKGETK